MADKVKMKYDGCETSLFHHGLIKLLVLNELQKINRDWSSFLFMSGFDMEALILAKNTKTKGNLSPPAESSQLVAIKAKRFVKLKPRKQVKNQAEKTLKTPSPAKQRLHGSKETKQKQAVDKQEVQRITRSQATTTKGKSTVLGSSDNLSLRGKLDDILHVIDIEESPIVQAGFVGINERK